MNTRPEVGQVIPFRNTTAVIIKVHPFGTIDVETPSGHTYRVTGLAFI